MGAALLYSGLALLGAACLVLLFAGRWKQRARIAAGQPAPTRWEHLPLEPLTGDPPAPVEALAGVQAQQDALLLVQPGGRVVYANPRAREWFGQHPAALNLERLARRARPSEAFFSLCAGESRARFSLDARLVEGSSYQVPYNGSCALLVSLHRLRLTQPAPPGGDGSSPFAAAPSQVSFDLFTELSQAMTASLDLSATLQAIGASFGRLIPADAIAISLWDSSAQHLVVYRAACASDQALRFEKVADQHGVAAGSTRLLIDRREPLFIPDAQAFPEAPSLAPAADDQQAGHPGIRSYLGAPLLLAGEPIGALELTALTAGAFGEDDLETVKLLSGQAAVALHNAAANAAEQRRTLERVGLAKIALSGGAVNPAENLFEQLVESARSLLAVEVLGFLTYDPTRRLLSAESPFHGFPADFLNLYQVAIPPDSPAESLWQAQEALVTTNAGEDERLQAFGFTAAAQAADLRQAVFVPLVSAGRSLGYLQAANKTDGSPFNQDDLHLLAIIAGQAALMIENAALIRQAQRRAQRAESLRRIASLVSSDATLDEILQWSLQELAHLLQADLGAVFLLDEAHGELRPHPASLFGFPPGADASPTALPLADPGFAQTATHTRNTFLTDDAGQEPNLPPHLHPWAERQQAASILSAPLLVGERGAGELVIASRARRHFSQPDLLTTATVAGQLAGAIERAYLASQSDESLRRRVEILDNLLQASQQLGGGQSLEGSLQTIAAGIQASTPFRIVLISTYDPHSGCLERIASAGIPPQDMASLRATPQPWSGIQKLLTETFRLGNAYFIPYEQMPVFPPEVHTYTAIPLERYGDGANAWHPEDVLIVPLLGAAGEPWGLISVDDPQDGLRPDRASLESLQVFASQAALIIESQRRLSEANRAAEQRADQLQALTSAATLIASSLSQAELVASLLDRLASFVPFDTAALWLREHDQLTLAAARGFSDTEERVGLTAAVEDSRLFGEMIQAGQPIAVSDVSADARFPRLGEDTPRAWLGIPLVAKDEVSGVIALEKGEPDFYQPQHIRLATAFAGQAAVALENAALYAVSVQRARELDQRSQRLALLQRLSSTLSGMLDEGEILALTLEQLAQALGGERAGSAPGERPVSVAAAAVMFVEGETLRFAQGDRRGQGNGRGSGDDEVDDDNLLSIDSLGLRRPLTPLLVAQVPARAMTLPQPLPSAPLFERLRASLGVFTSEDAAQEPELAPLADFLQERGMRGLLSVPLLAGKDLPGLVWVSSDQPYHFSSAEVELARTIANQAAIALGKARLFAETRRLAAELEQRVEQRTAELRRESQRTSALLHITTELSASLDLKQVLQRTLALLRQAVGAEQVLCLGRCPGETRLRLLAADGFDPPLPPEFDHALFDPAHRLTGDLLTGRAPTMLPDLWADPRWVFIPELHIQPRSAMAVPLLVAEEGLGLLLLFHSTPGYFSTDQLDLAQAAANQVAVTVNNAELYQLIRDQAEDLGSMLRSQQVETSRTRAILEAVAEGVLVTDSASRITLFNASAEHLLSLERAQVMGRSLEHFTGLFGKAALTWMETIRNWSGASGPHLPGEAYIEQINLDSGRVVTVNLAPVVFREEFLGTVSIFHDITHHVEVDRLKSEFVATVSHELRTPMTAIKGYVEILLMGAAGGISEQQTRFLEIVRNNAERLTVLVNDLLDISRIESGRVNLALQPLDLRSLASEMLGEFQRRAQADDKALALTLDAPADLPRISGDPERVREILLNLLSNAYHYTPPGGTITLRLGLSGAFVQLDVQDTGIGIPLAEQPRVFERFYRGENPLVLEISGTGLGLPIVRHLVQMHGGSIWLTSSGVPGEGSTFSLTLPVYQPAAGS